MKTLFLLLTGTVLCISGMAQTVIKIQPAEALTDSIVYQTENAVLIFDRQELLTYMTGMDTTLRNNNNSNKVFRNISLSRLNNIDMAAHYLKARCYLEDTLNQDLSYRTDKMNMLWAEDGGILLPYIEEILPELLNEGRLKLIERSNKAVQPAYKMIIEPINSAAYRVFRLNSGKEIFRESTFCVEQITHR